MSYSVNPIERSKYNDFNELKKHEKIIMNADDKALQRQAQLLARKEGVKDGVQTIKEGAMGSIASDVFVNGTTKGVDLASKTAKTANRLGKWTGAFAVLTGYDATMKKIVQNTDSLKEAAQKEPLATAFLYLTGAIATLTGSNSLYDYTKKQVKKKNPELVKNIDKHLNTMKKSLNKTWVNQEIIKPINNLSKKVATEAPTITKIAGKAAPVIPVGLMTYSFIKGVGEAINVSDEAKENYKELKQAQEAATLKHALAGIKELDYKINTLSYLANKIPENINPKKDIVDKNNIVDSDFDDTFFANEDVEESTEV